jgi:TrkA domain protein
MNVEETPLPGIGIRKEITLATGRRVGVVIHRDGRSELIVSRRDDPDASAEHRDSPGVNTEQVLIDPTSPFSGRTLGDTQLRTRTSASVVAILRSGEVLPSPTPDFGLRTGDVLVIVGTASGLASAAEILHPH